MITLTQKCQDGRRRPCYVDPDQIAAVHTGGDADLGAVITIRGGHGLMLCVKEPPITVHAAVARALAEQEAKA